MERFILRKDPIFEIIIQSDSFEIKNSYFTYNNEIYNYDEFSSVEFSKSATDWFPTILGVLISVFVAGRIGRDKTDDRFIFSNYSGKEMRISLINCDKEVIHQVYEILQKRINPDSQV